MNDDPGRVVKFYCEVIVDEADKMNKMVKKLLSLNQLEFGNGQVHLEHFDLQQVVQSVLSLLGNFVPPERSYPVCTMEIIRFYVWADEYMTGEVVMNYVSNALKIISMERKSSR